MTEEYLPNMECQRCRQQTVYRITSYAPEMEIDIYYICKTCDWSSEA